MAQPWEQDWSKPTGTKPDDEAAPPWERKWGTSHAAPPKAQDGQAVSGFKRSFQEVPGLLAGVGAFAADAVGADEARDSMLSYAKRKSDEVGAAHANDAQSITDAWDGKVAWGDFLANAAGYVAGQALQSILTGGAGALGAKMLANQGIKQVGVKVAAEQIAAGATEQVAKAAALKAMTDAGTKAAVRGGIAGATAQNLNMELGSIYPDAVEEAGGADKLDGGDRFRVLSAAALAAGVDTAGEALTALKWLKGSNAGGKTILARAAKEVPMGMAREAGTEAIQTGIEQYGAAKSYDLREIVDSAGIGAVGGGLGGAAAARTKREPDVGDVLGAGSVDDAINKAKGVLALPAPASGVASELVDGVLALPGPPTAPRPTMLRSLPAPDGGTIYMADEAGNVAPQPAAARAEAITRQAEADIAAAQQAAAERQRRDSLGKQTPRGAEPVERIPTGEATTFDALPTGEVSEAIPTGDATELEPIPAGEASELDVETIQPTDLLAKDGEPFVSKTGAQARAFASRGKVVTIPDHFGSGQPGYVVRPLMPAQPNNTRGTNAGDVARTAGQRADERGRGGGAAGVPDGRPGDVLASPAGAAGQGVDGGGAAGGGSAAPDALTPAKSMMKPGFDPDAWQKERDDRIKASREAGNVHLDKIPAYVETMRGKQINGVHDPKVKGRILTVDNNGNVYVEWTDAYSQEKEGAVPMQYGKKTVMQTSLGPRDLKDYRLAPDAAPAAAGPTLATGDRITLSGKSYTVVSASPSAVKLDDGQGGTRMVARNSKTFAAIQQEPNEAARPQPQAAGAEAAAPAAAPAGATAAEAVVSGSTTGTVEADGVGDGADPFTLDKRTLNVRINRLVSAGEATDSISGFMELRKRYMKATGKPSIPPAGTGFVAMYPDGAAVEADGLKPAVRMFGSSGYQLTMAQALAKVKELEADARKRKAAATKAPTAFMRDMDEKAASSSATLARKLREDIKQAVNSYPDARAEYAEARGEVTQPTSGEAAPAPAPEAAPAAAPTPDRTPKAQAVKEALANDRQPFEHAGLKVYPTKMRRDKVLVDAWAVQLPENRGTGKVLGDTLHTTIDEAKKSAEYEAKRDNDRKEWERKEEADRADREAKKEANRGKNITERAADFMLNQPNKLPPSAGLGTGTRREAMDKAVEQGRAIRAEPVEDTAAKNRDKKAVEAVSKAGYLLGASNENIPVVKAGLEARARLKADKYEKTEYRVYGGRLAEGPFHTITKIEYDYAVQQQAEQFAAEQGRPAPAPMDAATHKDTGEPAEPVTPAVVQEAIKTGVQATDRKPSAMKAELLAKIDAAIADAPDEVLPVWKPPTKDQIRTAMVGMKLTNMDRAEQALRTAHDNRVAEASRRIGHVNFSVEGDGQFKVLNSKPYLEEFRRKVAASPGFKAQRPGPLEGPRDGGENGSGGKVAAFDNMVNEGDLEAASDYADAVGLELDPKKIANASKVLKWRETRPAEPAPAPQPEAEAEAEAPAPTAEPAEQAAAILNAAAEPPKGKERLDVLKDVKAGAITPEEVAAAYPAAEPTEPAAITDVGEKIGGARKDTAESGGTKPKKGATDTRPAWARRFEISQIVTPGGMLGEVKDAGRWIIRDGRSLDWMKQPKQVGRSTFATKEEAEAYVPLAAVALKHRTIAARDGKYEIWRDINDRKRVKVVEQQFDSREDAMAYMLANAVQIIEANTTFGEADLPLPPDRKRTGPEKRTGNVTGKDFKDTFGLRGVEFGNWNNQNERQALMNDAWDGLMDLADVLALPPKALGLNGDLALAFGARGHGLNSARAHYEPARTVINLTKEQGAGSLAHEWFHALDHYFGRQDGKASATWVLNDDGTRSLKVDGGGAEMVSSGFRGERSGVRKELREAYEAMLRTMTKKAETYVEDTAKADRWTGVAREELAQALASLRRELAEQKDVRYYKRNNKPASAELLAEFDAIAKQMLDGEVSALATDWKTFAKGGDKPAGSRGASIATRWTNDSLERLSAIHKEVRGRSGFDGTNKQGVLDRLRGNMERYSQRLKMLAEAQGEVGKVRAVPTDFAMNARDLDQGRGTDYWTTPHEMAARAFQGYVEDKVAERGGVSRFLNYAPENAAILTPWGFKRPYPAGEERKAINGALDKFIGVLQTRADDAGNVALFSRAPGRSVELEAADAVGREFWRKIDNGESFTDQEVLDALSINRRGSRRLARGMRSIADQAGTGTAAVGWEGDLASFGPYTSRASWDGDNFNVFFIPDSLAGSADLNDDAQARDKALVHVSFKSAPGGSYELSLNDPQPGSTALAAVEAAGISAQVGVESKRYTQIALRAGDVTSRMVLQEAARRLALNIGRTPDLMYAGRDTGARTGKNTGPVEYGADTLRDKFSRTPGSRTGVPMADAKAVVATIREALPTAPEIVLHDSVRRAPENLRRLIRQAGADNDVEAVYHDGEIHVFPGNIASIERMQFVVAHHEVRHHGLRSMLGPQMGPAMLRMYASNPNLKAAADAKMAAGLADTRILAVEEALADMPVEELQALTGWARIVAAARQWLRQAAAKLRRAGLNTLADAMEPEGWTDNDIAALVQRAEDVSRGGAAPFRTGGTVFQRAYHGTPYRGIERFDTDAIGTGEGAQAYGWGLYFASKREVAEHYRETLSARDAKGYVDAHLNARRLVERFNGDPEWAAEVVKEQRDALAPSEENYTRLDQTLKFIESGDYAKPLPERGQLYEVEVPENNELLLWDRPVRDQPEAIREAIYSASPGKWMTGASGERRFIQPPDANMTGGAAYARISRLLGGDRQASDALRAAGVKGMKYLDGGSRSATGAGWRVRFKNGQYAAQVFPTEQTARDAASSTQYNNVDGVQYLEDGSFNYVIFSGDDAAIMGTAFSRRADQTQTPASGAVFSRAGTAKTTAPDWITSGSAALQGAAGKIDTYAPQKTMAEKAREMSAGWKQKMVQGMFDAYAPLKALSMDAYIAARMTKAADGAFEGMLMYGKPVMNADGGITGDLDGKGFLGAMRELNGEHDRFFMWLAGNRAERLYNETTGWTVRYTAPTGTEVVRNFEATEEAEKDAYVAKHGGAQVTRHKRENLFELEEIKAMKALNRGDMPAGTVTVNGVTTTIQTRPRIAAYKRALDEFNAYSKSVLDVAEKAGLIDGESRKLWEHDFYVPFYRMSQENEISGPTKIKGLVRQKAFERLKGGKENLGDLMDNTLRNWSHLLSASLANVAASKSLLAAEQAGVAFEAKEAQAKEMAKAAGLKGNATYFMDQGMQRWFVVEDPAILQAVSAMEAPALNGLPLQLMAKFKKYLTVGVTIAPAFKVRNLIRDTLAAPAANEMSFNIAKNLSQGWKATDTKTAGYAQMLFSGGLMRFGTYLEGDRAEHVKWLISQGVDDKTILNTPQKVKAMFIKAWDAWQDFGDRMENVNRTALYQQLLDKGMSPREAAFQARDMMDFSLQGSWAAVRTLTAVIPFLNARAQGLYKLGRAAATNPKRMGYMVAAVSLASIILMLAYEDDEDWKAREDWDRDAWWWFKIGDTAYRIPKPFEIGAMGTIAERSVELLINDEMTGARFAERMKQMVTGTFAINPVPQMFKPMMDLYANKDSFTGRQIETLGMERLSKPERYGPNTSALAKALGSAGEYTGISPVQVDHMIRAYFGWLGTMGAATVDAAVMPFEDMERPAKKVDDYFGGFVKELPAASSRYLEDFYTQAQATSEAMADLRRAREVGDTEKAAEIMEERGDKVALYRVYQQAQRQLADLNKRIRLVRGDTSMDGDTKRLRLDELTELRNRIARQVSDRTRAREAVPQ